MSGLNFLAAAVNHVQIGNGRSRFSESDDSPKYASGRHGGHRFVGLSPPHAQFSNEVEAPKISVRFVSATFEELS